MISIDKMRQSIVDYALGTDLDSLCFDDGVSIFWNNDMTEWIAIYEDETGDRCASYWDDLSRLIARYVSDAAIEAWYNEYPLEEEAAE